MKKLLALLLSVVMIASLAACGGTEEQVDTIDSIGEIVMGFVPSQDAAEIASTVEPLRAELEKQLGVPVKAEVVTDYNALSEGLKSKKIDIGFLPPFGYVKAEERANITVILKAVRFGASSYRAQYNVPADSDIQSIEDLVNTSGLVWAYGDNSSTSGFLFPANQLMSMGVENLDDHFTQTTAGGHDNAIVALLTGTADFATTYEDARTRVEEDYPDVMDKVRVIGYSDPIPNDGIVVREGLSDELIASIKTAFLSFNDNEEMVQVLKDVYNWTGIAEASPADYDIVRETYKIFKDSINE
ncbi:phosphonate ABC transporter substrate-binding protein [Lottiidibacillus patelloidae]|uniref:Phosphonate ABC transporter substrate-binding protein n=1 Tax=Lottiidibacillus patelloidae TaxID=2670334 RepID=A0A263BXA1_9BACI|nr:phosphate/phosphite/phosphonate ABC transporter substrate-binding protein [Lottiidibacillus patelloidae]OZM58192.1 phosphonate ABC transporter substrate-binding protein [Lottiidibacillus patelloidae]